MKTLGRKKFHLKNSILETRKYYKGWEVERKEPGPGLPETERGKERQK